MSRDVPAAAGLLCDTVAVLGVTTEEISGVLPADGS